MAHHRQQHLLPDLLNRKGIVANQDLAQIFDRGFDHPRPATRLAHAIDAGIGKDLNKEPIARLPATAIRHIGMHQVGFDFGDFHWNSFGKLGDW